MDFQQYIDRTIAPSVRLRIDVERRITDELVKALFGQGYVVRIHDGEAFCSKRTTDPVVVQKAIQSTDEDHIFVYLTNDPIHVGTITLMYGNSGHDVVSDWTSTPELDAIIQPIIEKYN